MPLRTAYALIMSGMLVVGVSACGSTVSGRAERVQPDPATLDVGNYQTKPREIGNAKNEKQARARESQRLADFVALPFEADPSYVEDAWALRPHIVYNQKSLGKLVINDTFDEVAKDLVAGWVNAWSTGGPREAARRTLSLAVMMFPDTKTAMTVGPTLEHDDFTYNRDNQPVAITKHPHTMAHWRPDVSSLGSWTVHDRYVVYVKVEDDTSAPDLPALTAQVEKMLDVQIPLLDMFRPTPSDELPRIPLDPGGLLSRTLPSNPESPIRADPDGVYADRGVMSLLDGTQNSLATLEKSKVDLVSFGDAVVFRSKTRQGADDLWAAWQPSKQLKSDQKLVGTPTGLGDHVECYAEIVANSQALGMNLCVFQVDRYTVQTFGKQLQDLHQKVSAQYALLTSK